MSDTGWYSSIVQTAVSTDWITWTATVSAVVYVLLALRENVWCWSFGILSSALSVYVYFTQLLWYEAALNLFYIAIGIYGWVKWNQRNTEAINNRIVKINLPKLIYIVSGGVCGSILLGYISHRYTSSTLPYADAFITSFSIIATWMTARKILENWILWIIIDGFAAGVYIFKGPELYLFAVLFAFYTIMSIAGYLSWRKKIRLSGELQ